MATDSFNSGGRGSPGGKTARNDITGKKIRTPPANDKYRNSPFWDQDRKPYGDQVREDLKAGRGPRIAPRGVFSV